MLTLNFPVFYHALMGTDRHPPIFNAINLLLVGKTWESSYMAEIRSDMASGLKKGTRNIPHLVLYNLEQKTDEALLKRLNTLGKEKKRKALICLTWLVHCGILSVSNTLSMEILTQQPSPDALLIKLFRASLAERNTALSRKDIDDICEARKHDDFPIAPPHAFLAKPAPSKIPDPQRKPDATYTSTVFLPFSWGAKTAAILSQIPPTPMSAMSISSFSRDCLNVGINEMSENLLNPNALSICKRYAIPADQIRAQFQENASQHLFVSDASDISQPLSHIEPFWWEDSWLYILSDGLAILCLDIGCRDISAIRRIVSPGRLSFAASYWLEQEGTYTPFSMNDKIEALARSYGLDTLIPAQPFTLYDIFVLNMAFTSESFQDPDEIRRESYNLHLFAPLGSDAADISQVFPSYVYANTSKGQKTYRWGCCIGVLDMGCVYSVPDPADALAEKDEIAEDIMPLIVLALQQRYIYRRLLDRMRLCHPDDKAAFLEIKSDYIRAMTSFLEPAEFSRWDNICKLYNFLVRNLQIKTFSEAISRRLRLIE